MSIEIKHNADEALVEIFEDGVSRIRISDQLINDLHEIHGVDALGELSRFLKDEFNGGTLFEVMTAIRKYTNENHTH